jgi:hypothetical protein
VFADEVQILVPDQRAGKQAGLAEDLETVADAHDKSALLCRVDHGFHDR